MCRRGEKERTRSRRGGEKEKKVNKQWEEEVGRLVELWLKEEKPEQPVPVEKIEAAMGRKRNKQKERRKRRQREEEMRQKRKEEDTVMEENDVAPVTRPVTKRQPPRNTPVRRSRSTKNRKPTKQGDGVCQYESFCGPWSAVSRAHK